MLARMNALQDIKRNLVTRLYSEGDERVKHAILQEVKAIKEDIKGWGDNLKASDEIPWKSNCSPY